ncbi:glycoside hydrolase family 3 N-terminal domain-containing protein [Ruania zhangjianzhongii]|uniref:glycoside hydrolase family 3 N-terminal domain-containing protein n=1 Tax=Ruania zhangjianzhongii TaxID=2603206 RepID=UPI00143CD5D0|nr:glycoside hydrolase family 3 N-terminal domain-containing protein [Ruania zhangjianzhongii]
MHRTTTPPSSAGSPRSPRQLALGVLMPGFNGATAPDWLLDAAAEGLGSVMLVAQNAPDIATTRALTDAVHAAGPVLITVDEEGGDVSRLQAASGSALPGAGALGAADDLDLTERAGAALGALVWAAGIDLDLAPVLDVASEPTNPVIGVRSYGSDADQVSRHGVAFLAGLHAGGVAGCAKHFPGHGATTTDSHLELPRLDISEQVLADRDLPPFEAAAAAGLDAVMTGHLHIPALGPKPASLEPAVTALARRLPGGEDRVIVTDALDMQAVSLADADGIGAACVRALQAGADLLCLGTTGGRDDVAIFEAAAEAIVGGLARGELAAEALERSIARVRTLQQRIAGYRAAAPELGPAEAEAAVAEVGLQAARAAVRVARGDVRLAGGGPPVLVDLRRRYNQATGRVAPGFANALADRAPDAQVVLAGAVDAPPLAEVLTGLGEGPVLALTREPLADVREQQDLSLLLARRPDAVVIHGGTADGAPAADRLVLAHGVGRANADAVLRLVLGS